METYRVAQKKRHCTFIAQALEKGGWTVISAPTPNMAPFVFRVLTPHGEVLELICYAFTANKYTQGGRPKDEHRFQIKYGSDFTRYHELYLSPDPRSITLFFGIHFAENIVIACDPTMHNPTWFSKSVEFKSEHVAATKLSGWFPWERQRTTGRRKRELLSEEDECLLGLNPQNFTDYVLAERLTQNVHPSHRYNALLHWHKDSLLTTTAANTHHVSDKRFHELELEYGLQATQLMDVIVGQDRLRTAVRGSVAEKHLYNQLVAIPELSPIWLDKDGQPDFEVSWKGQPSKLIECKVCSSKTYADGSPKADVQRTRAPQGNPCGRFYSPTEFNILAICLQPITGKWEFTFSDTALLPRKPKCPDRINNNVKISDNGNWSPDVRQLL